MEKTAEVPKDREIKAHEKAKRLEELNDRIKSRLINCQELYDQSQRMIASGSRVDQLVECYFYDGKRRPLIAEILHLVETENTKREQLSKEECSQKKEKREVTTEEVHQQIEAIRQQRKEEKKGCMTREQAAKEKLQHALALGDRVRVKDGRNVGTIDKIERGKVAISYSAFTTTVVLDELELVQRMK